MVRRLLERLFVLYLVVCLSVLAAGANKVWPQAGARVAALLKTPAMGLERPFPNCAEAQAAGYFNIPVGSPAYEPKQDGDADGLACEPYRGGPSPGLWRP